METILKEQLQYWTNELKKRKSNKLSNFKIKLAQRKVNELKQELKRV